MNTGLSSILGWGALTVGVGGALLLVRHQISQRRQEQEARGVRSSQRMTWEEKVLHEERKAKESLVDKEQRAKSKLSGTEEDAKHKRPASSTEHAARDTLDSAERKVRDALSAVDQKARVAVGKEK